MFRWFHSSCGYDKDNPCDAVIQQIIFSGEYVGEDREWIYIQHKQLIYRFLRRTTFTDKFGWCETTPCQSFDVMRVEESHWRTLWANKQPSGYAMDQAEEAFDRKRKYAWLKGIHGDGEGVGLHDKSIPKGGGNED